MPWSVRAATNKLGATCRTRAGRQVASAETACHNTAGGSPRLFTASDCWQEFIGSDPLTLRRITLRFALEDRKLTRLATALPEEITVPTLLMLAGRDRIIDNMRVRGFVEQMGCAERQIVEYPNAEHTLEFEPNAEAIFTDLQSWIGQLASRSTRQVTGP